MFNSKKHEPKYGMIIMIGNLLGSYLFKIQSDTMDGEPTVDEMWKVIEDFGISRKLIDPQNMAPYETVLEFYLLILERKKIAKELEKSPRL